MFGKIQQATANNNATELYKALSDLTIGRSENRGTLQVEKSGDSVTLSCVNHHFLSRRNTFVDNGGQNATMLRNLVWTAVQGELDSMKSGLMRNASAVEADAIKEKFDQLKAHFEKVILPDRNDGSYETFSRKAIGAVLQDVNALRDSLSVVGLQRMSVDELTRIAEDGTHGLEKLATGLKILDHNQQNLKMKLNGRIRVASVKANLAMARTLLGGLFKEIRDAAQRREGEIRRLLKFANGFGGGSAKAKAGNLARGIDNFLNADAADGKKMSIGLTRNEREELKDAVDLALGERGGDAPTDDELADGLNMRLDKYLLSLKDTARIFNNALRECGVKALQIDEGGGVSAVVGESEEQVREDCGRLLDLLTAASDGDGQSAIGIDTSYAKKDKTDVLARLLGVLNENMSEEEKVQVHFDVEPEEDGGDRSQMTRGELDEELEFNLERDD